MAQEGPNDGIYWHDDEVFHTLPPEIKSLLGGQGLFMLCLGEDVVFEHSSPLTLLRGTSRWSEAGPRWHFERLAKHAFLKALSFDLTYSAGKYRLVKIV
jgi:hypothetical protein